MAYLPTPQQDAEALHRAFKGLGTDDRTVIEIITNRTNDQLAYLAAEYKKLYGKSLKKALKSETSGDYCTLLCALVTPRVQYIAKQIHKAVDRAGTDEGALIDLLVFTSSAELHAANQFYQHKYKKSISHDVGDDTSGDFKKSLLALIEHNRDIPPGPPAQAAADAHALYKAGEGKIGTNEKVFIELLCARPLLHTWNIAQAYKQERGKKLTKAIKSETSGYFCRTLLATVTPWPQFWAKRIHHAVAGVGTKDALLIRAFVLNNKPQLQAIAQAYAAKYKKSMYDDVKSDTSFNYQKVLTSLLK
eukprot:TRINITY_DN26950_c0_g1_i1.p1 TRINITY_DN26950_c0_g1~~TRINITY_DN26950_c0_g1_i1.p1  ORF type:complete len:304 (+),score=101.45 TRINITY_DN26950_c0_g1_i1:151-1062(+)